MTKLDSAQTKHSIPTNGYQPTAGQLDRAKAAQRFTRLFVYLPLGVVSALLGLIAVYLLYLALFPPEADTRLFLSALADFILVIYLIPLVIVFGLLLVGGVGGYIYYRFFLDESERPLPPAPPYGRIRTLLWRLDDLLLRLMPMVEKATQQISKPIMRLYAWFAYLESWFKSLKSFLLRR